MKKIELLPNVQIDKNSNQLFKIIVSKLRKLEKLAEKKDIERLDNKIDCLKQDMEKLELKMVIKLGSLIAFSISILATLLTISN